MIQYSCLSSLVFTGAVAMLQDSWSILTERTLCGTWSTGGGYFPSFLAWPLPPALPLYFEKEKYEN